MTHPLVPLTPERAQAAKAEVADAVLPHVRTLARRQFGAVRYFAVRPVLRWLVVALIDLAVAGLAPQLLPFLDLIEAALALIDPARLSDDARRIVETFLGLMRTDPSPEVAYAMAHPDDSDYRVTFHAVDAPEPIRKPL